ncbi:MAG: Histidine kinase-, DNA gyrase B-, and [Candidatus Nomurabacteria bacterium GW2011_GWF2_40_12]|uniref:Histidine kinase-, DNA gyrase B-, and n=1 Tax=Candidatus Nomurabacteria bacterium GW2011_GWF2_40_12 TaxID=1618776 RepID=A0A0G0QP19_9BACT|nr:MAG: Histidine kinase-, DNA gyrase B-, and [Candidatus Nomurabacteria bacterium GW2011_GWF2_40_12]
MICYLFSEPTYFLYSPDVPTILYYAQVPATLIALLISFYAFWNGRHLLLNKLLLVISILFSFWTLSTLIAWTNIHSNFIMFVWSFFGLILSLISIFCIYFIYVFLEKKDISSKIKGVFLALLAPIFIIAPTSFNINGFNLTVCDAFNFEWLPFKFYYTSLGVIAMIWILTLLILKYRTATSDLKKQIILMGVGLELFLFSFFGMEFVATSFARIGLLPSSEIELYGLFGMVIFMIYISILMVQFKTFNVKLIATQALVWGLAILIGSQFFFIQVPINMVLNGFTFVASVVLGFFLIRSVKKEIQQKEELLKLTINLRSLLKQRESLVHLVTHKVKGSFTRTKFIFAGILDGTFGPISPEVKKIAEQGLEFDNGGIETVDLVLNAANLQNGIIKYDMKNIDLKEIVLKTINDKKLAIEAKGLKVETEINDGGYNIMGDSFWLNIREKEK